MPTPTQEFLLAPEAASLCGWSTKTLLSRRSLKLPTPPAIALPNSTRLLWRRNAVVAWLEGFRETPPKKRGRPRKAP